MSWKRFVLTFCIRMKKIKYIFFIITWLLAHITIDGREREAYIECNPLNCLCRRCVRCIKANMTYILLNRMLSELSYKNQTTAICVHARSYLPINNIDWLSVISVTNLLRVACVAVWVTWTPKQRDAPSITLRFSMYWEKNNIKI